jgi:hypothetical protein
MERALGGLGKKDLDEAREKEGQRFCLFRFTSSWVEAAFCSVKACHCLEGPAINPSRAQVFRTCVSYSAFALSFPEAFGWKPVETFHRLEDHWLTEKGLVFLALFVLCLGFVLSDARGRRAMVLSSPIVGWAMNKACFPFRVHSCAWAIGKNGPLPPLRALFTLSVLIGLHQPTLGSFDIAGQLEVRCEFCNELVVFGAEDLQRIASNLEPYEIS